MAVFTFQTLLLLDIQRETLQKVSVWGLTVVLPTGTAHLVRLLFIAKTMTRDLVSLTDNSTCHIL